MFTVKRQHFYDPHTEEDRLRMIQSVSECESYTVEERLLEEDKQPSYSVICITSDERDGSGGIDHYNYHCRYDDEAIYVENERGQTVDIFRGKNERPEWHKTGERPE